MALPFLMQLLMWIYADSYRQLLSLRISAHTGVAIFSSGCAAKMKQEIATWGYALLAMTQEDCTGFKN